MFVNEDPFVGYTVILFVTFVFVMTIIMMNLITGLALDDIQKIAENAEFQNLSMQVYSTIYPIHSKRTHGSYFYQGWISSWFRKTLQEHHVLWFQRKIQVQREDLHHYQRSRAINPILSRISIKGIHNIIDYGSNWWLRYSCLDLVQNNCLSIHCLRVNWHNRDSIEQAKGIEE